LSEDYITPEGLHIPYPDSTLKILDCTVPSELKILRTVCKNVTKREVGHESYQKLASMMIRTMMDSNGVGLAAIQIGIPKRLIIVYDIFAKQPRVILNPRLKSEGYQTQDSTEQCLSVPGLQVTVKRPLNLIVKGKTLDWKDYEVELQYEAAAIVSHETDHLNGVLLIDHLGKLQRKLYNEKAKKVRKQAKRIAKQYMKEQRHGATEQDQ
jgi:peptide deformylase